MPDCAVPLTDPQVSRHHAEVRRDERGYHIVDLGSTNGIEVNGVRVRDHLLVPGDLIVVGATTIAYEES
jgi:pSer/pThr/pTyr-binding forkhead associated (FHA) protein